MKKLYLMIIALVFLNTLGFGQEMDEKGKLKRRQICLWAVEDGIADLDPALNRKVAKLIKAIDKKYDGYHAIHNEVRYIKNYKGDVLAKTRQIDYVVHSEKWGYSFESLMLIQEGLGGNSFGNMYVDGYYQTQGMDASVTVDNPYGDFITYKKTGCDCLKKYTNWLTATGGGNSDGDNSGGGTGGVTMNKPEVHPDGPYTKKSSDGTWTETGEYKGNKKVGTWKMMNVTGGSMIKETVYALDGSYKETNYLPGGNGNKQSVINSNAKGERNGIVQFYDSKGNIEDETTYVNGEKTGPHKSFSNSQLEKSGSYINGQQNGAWKFYDTKGVLEYERTYTNGTENGPCKSYYQGKLSTSGQYKDGKKDGVWSTYDRETGKVKGTEKYKDGEPVQ